MATRLIPESALIVVARDVLASDFGAEQVLLNLKDGVYYGLEGVGARIWQLLQRPVTVNAILDTLVQEYDVDRATGESDLRALLQDLVARGLAEIREHR